MRNDHSPLARPSSRSVCRLPAALVAAAVLIGFCASPAAATETEFEAGALIIPMDTDYQDWGTLRAFGLVYALLLNDIPVNWVIDPDKTASIDGDGLVTSSPDFTAQAIDLASGATISPDHGYRAGPFVIDAVFAVEAGAVIDQFWLDHPITTDPLRNVTVHEATAPFSGTVSRRLVVAPSIAMFADGNQDVAREYCQAAAIPDSTGDFLWPDTSPDMLDPDEVIGTFAIDNDGALFDDYGNPAYCQLMSMHWNGGDTDEVVAEVRSYLTHPVHFFAECKAVNTFENNVNGLFLTHNGFSIAHPGTPYDYLHVEQPFAQLDGPFEGAGGSEPGYSVCSDGGCQLGEGFKTDNVVMFTEAGTIPQSGISDLWMTGFLDGACPPDAAECLSGGGTGGVGKVSYLGGHQYDVKLPISENSLTNGTRLFLQSLFEAPCATESGHPRVIVEKTGPAIVTDDAVTWTIGYRNDGPSVIIDAHVVDTLPAGTTFVDASGDHAVLDGVVTWPVGNLGAGQGGTVTVTVTLASYGVYENFAIMNYDVGLNSLSATSNTAVTNYDIDSDGDGVIDLLDNCPDDYNPLQDLQVDANSCGTCGNVCVADHGSSACTAGACVITSCDAGFSDCNGDPADGCEYDVAGFATDTGHCGGCNAVCDLDHAGESCEAGVCVLGPCDTDWADCNGAAADGCEYHVSGFQTDISHCGGCGSACAPANAFGICQAGVCNVGSCFPGAADCNEDESDGCEFDAATLLSDPDNCGGCGQVCVVERATAACTGGTCVVGTCDDGFSDCNGQGADGCEYVNTGFVSDPDHCGGCGQACAPAHGAGVCADGSCQLVSCDEGWVDCNEQAVDGCEHAVADFAWDVDNCGGCGQACQRDNATPACVSGSCRVLSCDAGWSDCNGEDADGCERSDATFASDLSHCGGCNQACAPLHSDGACVDGACEVGSCVDGWSDCNATAADGCEYDDSGFATDSDNCGGCGQPCHPVNAVGGCVDGVCQIGDCIGAFRDCNADPADGCEYNIIGFVDDIANCGGCAIACDAPNASPVCASGICDIGACDDGWVDCDEDLDNGCEYEAANFEGDALNCGGCGVACSAANGTGACVDGICTIDDCESGFDDCDADVSNGCEYPVADFATDASNCGGCGLRCDPDNADGECVDGSCRIGSCSAGWADCNGDPADGCEVPATVLATDTENCGACGHRCAGENAASACADGECVIESCDEDWVDCDGQAANGCELAAASLASDPFNCGGCGQVCESDNGVPTCVDGVCGLGSCEAGWADCNDMVADGCEYETINLATDDANCGACGAVCNPPHALGECVDGQCTLLACDGGFTDCDGDLSNGCEFESFEFLTDPFNCGGCATRCLGPDELFACDAGSCFIGTCDPGLVDCNGVVSDGCEYRATDFDTDPTNCGGCNVACTPDNGVGTCTDGVCGVICANGFANCDGDASNGCEVPVSSFDDDPAHCGGCGVQCALAHAVSTCDQGVCAIAECEDGFSNADGIAENGCELTCQAIGTADTTCDGVDDDCDGQADEDYVAAITHCGTGACAATGTGQCVDGVAVDDCVAGSPDEESKAAGTCADAIDNDCDGLVDGDDLDCEACGFDSDCDDGDPCTEDQCVAGACSATQRTTPECVTSEPDAGTQPDAGSIADDDPNTSQRDTDESSSGCTGAQLPHHSLLWLSAVALLLLRRRRWSPHPAQGRG